MKPAPVLFGPVGVERCVALLTYEGPATALVKALKYRNERHSAAWLAGGMAALVADTAFVAVSWAPTSTGRRRKRGFDQAELLARRIGRRLGCPASALLERSAAAPQTGLGRAERWVGPTFAARPTVAEIRAGPVLLVDDVITTGATLAAAARALGLGPANPLVALLAAATPRTHSP